MQAVEVIKLAAKSAGIPIYRIGLEMGKTKQYMSGLIARGSTPKVDTMARMLDVCGYGLFAIPHDEEPPCAIQITADKD